MAVDEQDEEIAATARSTTVVIPAFNAIGYIGSALAGIAGQSVRPSEVIIVDDLSTDETVESAARWQDVLPLKILRHDENQGPGAARRTAIAEASGDLIALLDCDDVWLPDHLQLMLSTYLTSPGLITARNYRWFRGQRVASVDSAELTPIPPPDDQVAAILSSNFLFTGTLFAIADYHAAGGFSDRRLSEDWEMWIRMVRNGVTVSAAPYPTVLYRQRPDSLSTDDGVLAHDIQLLDELLTESLSAEECKLVQTALRRRQARQQMLEGMAAARAGRKREARGALIRAAMRDRNLSGGFDVGPSGSVTVKALTAAFAPRTVVRHRDDLLLDPDRQLLYRRGACDARVEKPPKYGRISVIVPAYNAAEVLPAALASIAGQTVQPDEVIVIDDGSTDGTSCVAQEWSALLPVRLVRLEENIGEGVSPGGARARGIDVAEGDLIALLDADDVWFPDHLETMSASHASHGGLITANYYLWSPGRAISTSPAGQLIPVPPPEEQVEALMSENFVFISSMFTRDQYEEAGGFRNVRCEDWDLWIRMVRAGARVHMPDQVTALYRRDPSSVSGGDKLLTGELDILRGLATELEGRELDIVLSALRRREAKCLFLEGVELAQAGSVAAARRVWLAALRKDPSLRGNNSKLNGRVAPRALACIVAPEKMMRVRQRRQADASFVVSARQRG